MFANKSNVCGINKPPVNQLVVLGVLIQQYDEIGDGKYCNRRLFVVRPTCTPATQLLNGDSTSP